jgi:hypothetical protein
MRNSPSRTRDAIKNGKGKKSIVMCVPAFHAHIGLPFLGPISVSAAATRRAVDVLRREVRAAALTGGAEGMNDIEVVSVEVGALGFPPFAGRCMLDYDPKEYIKSWTPSEKLAYGPAWEFTLEGFNSGKRQYMAQKVERFVGDLVQIVSYGRVCSVSLYGLQFHSGSILGWLRGGRYAFGSGNVVALSIPAAVYLADISFLPLPSAVGVGSTLSHLPGALVDFIINIPYYVLSRHPALTRNRESASISSSATAPELPSAPAPAPSPVSRPLPSRPLPSRPLPTPPEAPATVTMTVAKETVQVDSAPSSEHEHEASENGSEADVESNDSAGVGESWISLQPNSTMASSETITA